MGGVRGSPMVYRCERGGFGGGSMIFDGAGTNTKTKL